MRGRLLTVALCVVALGLVGVTVGAATRDAVADATCSLPGTVFCASDSDCIAFGATCDVPANACVCAGTDMGIGDGGADLADSDGGGGSGGSGGGIGSGVPGPGGGMTGPPKTGGCSFAPGSR